MTLTVRLRGVWYCMCILSFLCRVQWRWLRFLTYEKRSSKLRQYCYTEQSHSQYGEQEWNYYLIYFTGTGSWGPSRAEGCQRTPLTGQNGSNNLNWSLLIVAMAIPSQTSDWHGYRHTSVQVRETTFSILKPSWIEMFIIWYLTGGGCILSGSLRSVYIQLVVYLTLTTPTFSTLWWSFWLKMT